MKIIITEEAHKDIETIYFYISQYSYEYANKTIYGIYSSIDVLKQMPYIGRYIPEILNKNYREIIYRNYRIVYKISEKNLVQIIFILHSRRNFKSICEFLNK